ncbi:MAG: hypothetical protein SFU25_01615 [Candidatus Caenarcaniphilales bacterium]|nr:hypothetical protein [Candidatus Caenarcaniphilales bacterium]
MPLKIAEEYKSLWDSVINDVGLEKELAIIEKRIIAGVDSYLHVANELGIPWEIVASIHEMESDCHFGTHLHNGDPLSSRTTHVPKGRPKADPKNGSVYTWSESAIDAFIYQAGVRNVALSFIRWNVEGALGWLEAWNGYGYRKRNINSPYLWGKTNHYQKGLFTSDGKFNPEVRTKQIGCVPILKRLGFTPV